MKSQPGLCETEYVLNKDRIVLPNDRNAFWHRGMDASPKFLEHGSILFQIVLLVAWVLCLSLLLALVYGMVGYYGDEVFMNPDWLTVLYYAFLRYKCFGFLF